MAGQNIDFKNAGDTGYRTDQDAIEKYDDGEQAISSVLNRPNENLRYRSETLRTEGEAGKYRHDADMSWIIAPGNEYGLNPSPLPMPSVTFDKDGGTSGGIFVLSADIVLQPMGTPAADVKEAKAYTFDFTGPPAQTAVFTFTADLFSYAGANWREIIWEEVAAASISGAANVIVEGSPLHRVRIQFSDAGAIASDVNTAIIEEIGSINAAGLSYVMVGYGPTPIVMPPDPTYIMKGTREREMHYITSGAINTFFGTEANELADGDTIAVYYEWLEETSPGVGGRRQSTPTTERTGSPPNTEIIAGQLFNTSTNPERIPFCIPLAKRIGDELIFIDGTLVQDEDVQLGFVHFGEHGYTVNLVNDAINNATSVVNTKWKNDSYLNDDPGPEDVEFFIEPALNYIIGDLAGNDGAARIGMNTFASPPTPASSAVVGFLNTSSLETNLRTLLNTVNNRAALNANETVTGNYTHTGDVTLQGSTLNVDTGAAIQLLSDPVNMLISGFQTRTYLDSGNNNRVLLSGGQALVGGKPIVVNAETALDDFESLFSIGTDLPVGDSSQYYYIWLRSDGNFMVTDVGPEYHATLKKYTVPAAEVQATYTVNDYLLVDLVFTHKASATPQATWYYVAHYAGGSLRYFQETDIVFEVFNFDTPSTYPTTGSYVSTLKDNSLPGIPTAVTNLAYVGLNLRANDAAGTGSDWMHTTIYEPIVGYDVEYSNVERLSVTQRIYQSASSIGDKTRGQLLVNADNEFRREHDASLTVADVDVVLCSMALFGFYWDRKEAPQILHDYTAP